MNSFFLRWMCQQYAIELFFLLVFVYLSCVPKHRNHGMYKLLLLLAEHCFLAVLWGFVYTILRFRCVFFSFFLLASLLFNVIQFFFVSFFSLALLFVYNKTHSFIWWNLLWYFTFCYPFHSYKTKSWPIGSWERMCVCVCAWVSECVSVYSQNNQFITYAREPRLPQLNNFGYVLEMQHIYVMLWSSKPNYSYG